MVRGNGSRRKWILASASPRRSEILSNLGLTFLVDPCGTPEPARNPHESPSRYAARVAILKAEAVSRRHKSGLVIAADTIVVSGNSILGKPESRDDAQSMLRSLSGRWHEVLSGICLLDIARKRIHSDCIRSRVHFRRLSIAEIEWYLDREEYRDKAGAYGVQGYASLFIDRIEGCFFNIVGFPVAAFEKLCRKAGTPLLQNGKLGD